MNLDYYIGFPGCGNDVELELLEETAKAYKLKDDYGRVFWMPKSCFDDNGSLTKDGVGLYEDKMKELEKRRG